ncbi:murein biosynthesis integral membrane protein MurJ [Neisseriaceae bacterium PsAf]|nr:murein biosynthesis integral membrane protein MurJ [Neisseriaceae bacterium PsAf]
MNLAKSFVSISAFTFLSRILGFVRDMLITQYFGATKVTDAFWLAFRIPNLLRRIFAEGAFSQAFVPILSDFKKNKSHAEAVEFTQKVCGLLSFILFIVTVIGIIASPFLVTIVGSGFLKDPEQFYLASDLLKIMFPYIFFISLTSFFSAILNTHNKFSIPAITPIFLNVSLIIFAAWISPFFAQPIYALAWGVFVAGVVQLLFQLPFVAKLGFLKLPKLAWNDPVINRVIKAMGVIIIGVSAGQISFVINSNYASYMIKGSITWQYVSDRLMELPSGLLGVALGTILLPTLAKFSAQNKQEEFSDLLDWGLRLSVLLALPSAVGLAVLAMPLIMTLFQHGQFTLYDANMTYPAVMAYSVAVPGFIFVKILAPGFTSRQDYTTPVKIGFFILFFTQFLNLFLVLYFKLGIVGLNLSIGLAACANSFILYYLLRKKNYYTPKKGWLLFSFKVTTAVAIMGFSLYFLLNQTYYPIKWDISAYMRVVQLSVLIVIGIIVYFSALFLLGFKKSNFMKRV